MRHHLALNEALAPLGLTIVQWDALRHISEQPDASLHDLAQLTFQSDQSFGTLAARMIERDLIERVAGPGRAVHHRLTDRGATLRAAGADVVVRVLAKSFAPLSTDQLAAFDETLRQLLDTNDVTAPRGRYPSRDFT
jgi:DNA-binding MarR family transcriptional regulator